MTKKIKHINEPLQLIAPCPKANIFICLNTNVLNYLISFFTMKDRLTLSKFLRRLREVLGSVEVLKILKEFSSKGLNTLTQLSCHFDLLLSKSSHNMDRLKLATGIFATDLIAKEDFKCWNGCFNFLCMIGDYTHLSLKKKIWIENATCSWGSLFIKFILKDTGVVQNVSHLILKKCKLSDSSLQLIRNHIKESKVLKILDLADNMFGFNTLNNEPCLKFLECVASSSLEELDLQMNYFGDRHLRMINKVVAESHLVQLDFTNNYFSLEELFALNPKRNKSIEGLFLTNRTDKYGVSFDLNYKYIQFLDESEIDVEKLTVGQNRNVVNFTGVYSSSLNLKGIKQFLEYWDIKSIIILPSDIDYWKYSIENWIEVLNRKKILQHISFTGDTCYIRFNQLLEAFWNKVELEFYKMPKAGNELLFSLLSSDKINRIIYRRIEVDFKTCFSISSFMRFVENFERITFFRCINQARIKKEVIWGNKEKVFFE